MLFFVAMVAHVSPDLTVYHVLHSAVVPELVGAGGAGYEVVGLWFGSLFASTQYDWPLIVKFPHVDVIDGFCARDGQLLFS